MPMTFLGTAALRQPAPIADIPRSRRWANTDREFTFADDHPDADYHSDEPGV